MNISELRARQGSVNLEAVVKSIEEPRAFNKFGRDLRVTNAVIEDDSGSIKLTLWNDDIDNVHVGDTVKVTNGFINEFKGENQLTTGKFGKLEVNNHGSESRGQAKEAKGATEEEADINEPEAMEESKDAPEDDAEEDIEEDY